MSVRYPFAFYFPKMFDLATERKQEVFFGACHTCIMKSTEVQILTVKYRSFGLRTSLHVLNENPSVEIELYQTNVKCLKFIYRASFQQKSH